MITEHSFDIELAMRVGVNASIIFKNLEFWITKNKANGSNFIDGHHWTYNSNAAFLELFPYMGKKAIENALNKLKDADLITWERNFNPENKHDSTRYFRLIQKANSETSQKVTSEDPKGDLVNRTDINTDINTDIKNKQKNFTFSLSKATQYKNLSEEYKQNLLAYAVTKAGNKAKDLLEAMVDYHTSKGKGFKDWAAAFRTWHRNDQSFKRGLASGYTSKEPEVGSLDWQAAQAAKAEEAIEAEIA